MFRWSTATADQAGHPDHREEAIESGIEELCIITQPGRRSTTAILRRLDDEMVKSFRGRLGDLESENWPLWERLHFAEQDTPRLRAACIRRRNSSA